MNTYLLYSYSSTSPKIYIVKVPFAAVGQTLAQTPQPVQWRWSGYIQNLYTPCYLTIGFLASNHFIGALAISSSVARYGRITACGQTLTHYKH